MPAFVRKLFPVNCNLYPHKGFTLVELLVAISIIAVLSAVGIAVFSNVSTKARDTTRKNDLKQIQIALELYYEIENKYPIVQTSGCVEVKSGALGEKFDKYLKTPPEDPKQSEDPEFKYCYAIDDQGEYTLTAKLENCEESNVSASACTYVISSDDSYIAQAPIPKDLENPAIVLDPVSNPVGGSSQSGLRVFVTSATYNGNLGGIVGADQKCQQAANAITSLREKQWRAWISDNNVDAKDRIHDSKYVLLNGTLVATNKTDLRSGNLNSPINVTETMGAPSISNSVITGDSEGVAYVWTGTDDSGVKTVNSCGNWIDPEAARGTVGRTDAKDIAWTNFTSSTSFEYCTSAQRHLYCFEQITPSITDSGSCLKGYQDYDMDNYTEGGAKYFCGQTTLPYGYTATASAQNDCYDTNPNVYPGQTQFFNIERGDGSFDYDCSRGTEPKYPNLGQGCGLNQIYGGPGSCFAGQACGGLGRATTIDDCGQAASYVNTNSDMIQCDEGGLPLWSRNNEKLSCR